MAANRGPDGYRDPVKFFSRTCFTKLLREHMGLVLRRLAGSTVNSAYEHGRELRGAHTFPLAG